MTNAGRILPKIAPTTAKMNEQANTVEELTGQGSQGTSRDSHV